MHFLSKNSITIQKKQKNTIYSIKEIYYTLQGEGFHTGRAAIFLRFAGCNLWTGLEKDRANAICQFCDTDFFGTNGVNGGKYSALKLVEQCLALWPKDIGQKPFVVCTGGEPALQLKKELIQEFKNQQFEIAIETNGTIALAEGIDWICVSPKANTKIVVEAGDELKIVFPQGGISPKIFEDLDFTHFYVQPLEDPNLKNNTLQAIDFCKQNPKWKLSVQMHKYLQIP